MLNYSACAGNAGCYPARGQVRWCIVPVDGLAPVTVDVRLIDTAVYRQNSRRAAVCEADDRIPLHAVETHTVSVKIHILCVYG